MRHTFAVCAIVLAVPSVALAQTRLNPDLSVVGDFRLDMHDDPARASERDNVNFRDPGAEIVIGGYLNPYARADATFAWHEGTNAAIEELYVTFLRGLPLGTNLRVGQYLLEFGRLNPVHPHAYSFIQRPLPQVEFFGDHGLLDLAVRGAWLLPTGAAYTEVMFAALQGDPLAEHHHEHSDSDTVETRYPVAWFGRLTTSLAVSDNAELAIGGSGMTAVWEPDQSLRAWLAGFDVKYKWRPSRYTSLTLEGEVLANRRDVDSQTHVTTYGGYAYCDYRFVQRFNLGVIGEYTQGALDRDADAWRGGLFVGFAPVEETSLVRLLGSWTEPHSADGYWSFMLQLVIGLGPHQPHNF